MSRQISQSFMTDVDLITVSAKSKMAKELQTNSRRLLEGTVNPPRERASKYLFVLSLFSCWTIISSQFSQWNRQCNFVAT